MAKITITKDHVTQIREDRYGNLEYLYPKNTIEDVLMDQESEEDIRGHVTYYATCNTAINSKVKEISVIDGKVDIVKKGVTFIVTFPNGSTAAPPVSLSVNGGTPITVDGMMESNVDAGQHMILTYNGSRFVIAGAAGVPITEERIVGQTPSKTRYLTFVDGTSGSGKFKIDPQMKIDKDGLTMKLSKSTVEFTPEPDTLLTDNRPNYTPSTGDTLATLIMKIRKILGGLGALAFRSNVGTAQLDTTLSQDYTLTVHKKGTINGAAVNDLYNGLNYGKKADGTIDANYVGKMAMDAVVGVTLQKSIDTINSKIQSFEDAKGKIVASALGKARGMATTWTWNQIITNIQGISTKTTGSSSQTSTGKWDVNGSDGAWMYIPENGYYTTGYKVTIPWAQVKTKLGNASDGHVLSGIRYSSQNGIYKTGNMANNGKTDHTFTPSKDPQTWSIPTGYHNGGVVTCKAISLSGNAEREHVLSGKIFYKKDANPLTGSMANKGALNWTPSGGDTTSVAAGYYSGGTLDSRTAYNNGYNSGYNVGKEDGRNEATGTIAVGTCTFPDQGRNDWASIADCGFKPDIIIGNNATTNHFCAMAYLNPAITSAGYSLNHIFRRNGESNAITDRIRVTDTGFGVSGNLDHASNRTLWYVAIKVS